MGRETEQGGSSHWILLLLEILGVLLVIAVAIAAVLVGLGALVLRDVSSWAGLPVVAWSALSFSGSLVVSLIVWRSGKETQGRRVLIGVVAGLASYAAIIFMLVMLLASGQHYGAFYRAGTEATTVGIMLAVALLVIPPAVMYGIIHNHIRLTLSAFLTLVILLGGLGAFYVVPEFGIDPFRRRDVEEYRAPSPISTPQRAFPVVGAGDPFILKVGQIVRVGREGPIVEFIEVVEDSRCPTSAECIQAGQARILLRTYSTLDDFGGGVAARDIALETGMANTETWSVAGSEDDFLFELVALNPYPQTTTPEQQPEYVATLVVSRTPRNP